MANDRIEFVKALFPVGSRIILIYMEDPQAPPRGTKGTVTGVDDLGDLLVDWDNGSGLKAIFGKDIFIHDDHGVTCFNDQYKMEAFCTRLREMEIDYELVVRNWGDGHLEYVVKPRKEEQT